MCTRCIHELEILFLRVFLSVHLFYYALQSLFAKELTNFAEFNQYLYQYFFIPNDLFSFKVVEFTPSITDFTAIVLSRRYFSWLVKIELWTLAWKWWTSFVCLFHSLSLFFSSAATSHRLKKNNFRFFDF